MNDTTKDQHAELMLRVKDYASFAGTLQAVDAFARTLTDKIAELDRMAEDLQALCDKQALMLGDRDAQLEAVGAGGVSQLTPAAQKDAAYEYASQLAISLFNKHYANDPDYASGRVVWALLDSTIGVLTQIDNMVSGLDQPAPARPLEVAAPVTDAEILEACGDFARDAIGKTNIIRIGRQLIAFAASRAPVALPAEPDAAINAMRIALITQIHELIDVADRQSRRMHKQGDTEERDYIDGAIAHARKVSDPFNYNGPLATPTAQAERPEPDYQAMDVRIRNAGNTLANAAFNLSQQGGQMLEDRTAKTLKKLQGEWDAAIAAKGQS